MLILFLEDMALSSSKKQKLHRKPFKSKMVNPSAQSSPRIKRAKKNWLSLSMSQGKSAKEWLRSVLPTFMWKTSQKRHKESSMIVTYWPSSLNSVKFSMLLSWKMLTANQKVSASCASRNGKTHWRQKRLSVRMTANFQSCMWVSLKLKSSAK